MDADKRRTRLAIAASFFAVFSIAVFASVQLSVSSRLQSSLRTQKIPTGMLDYGEKGKILKSLGFVYPVQNDYTRYKPNNSMPARPGLFRRKREVNDQVYTANPGGVYELPSALVMDPLVHGDTWSIVSVALDPAALTHPYEGMVNNAYPREINRERRATVSFFKGGRLWSGANVGIKAHGSRSERMVMSGRVDQDYRLLFRRTHGVESVSLQGLFENPDGLVKRLVLSRGSLFREELALDIFERVGAIVPNRVPVVFYLNGRDLGSYTLREHVSPRQWQTRLGHGDFLLFRSQGPNNAEAARRHGALWSWYHENRKWIDEHSAATRVDIAALTRDLIAAMFCGDDNFGRGAGFLDSSSPAPRWRWISWGLEESFGSEPDEESGQTDAFDRVVTLDRTSNFWNTRRRGFRPQLFARLLNNSSTYRKQFQRTVTDVLNHEITAAFLEERFTHYSRLLDGYEASSDSSDSREFEEILAFLRRRPDRLRQEVNNGFDLGGVFEVRVSASDGRRIFVDGYPESLPHAGKYFNNQHVRLSVNPAGGVDAVTWIVNGDILRGLSIEIKVTSDLEILLEPPGRVGESADASRN